jgi:hypothetical protein
MASRHTTGLARNVETVHKSPAHRSSAARRRKTSDDTPCGQKRTGRITRCGRPSVATAECAYAHRRTFCVGCPRCWRCGAMGAGNLRMTDGVPDGSGSSARRAAVRIAAWSSGPNTSSIASANSLAKALFRARRASCRPRAIRQKYPALASSGGNAKRLITAIERSSRIGWPDCRRFNRQQSGG